MYKIEYQNYLNQAYQKFGTNLPLHVDVDTYYQSLTAEHLKDLCRIYGIKGYSKLKKAELIDVVKNTVFSKESIIELYLTTPQKEFKTVLDLARKGALHLKALDLNLALRIVNLGMAYMAQENNQTYVVIAKDVRAQFTSINYSQFQKEAKQTMEILETCLAATHLYGVVKMDEAATLYKHYFKHVHPETFAKAMVLADRKLVDFGIVDDYIFSLSLVNDFKAYYEQNAQYEFYLPKKDRFLAYANDMYFENDSNIESMRAFLKLSFVMPNEAREDLLNDMITYFYNDGKFSEVMALFTMYGLKFKDENHVQNIGSRLQMFYSGLRLRKYRGNYAN